MIFAIIVGFYVIFIASVFVNTIYLNVKTTEKIKTFSIEMKKVFYNKEKVFIKKVIFKHTLSIKQTITIAILIALLSGGLTFLLDKVNPLYLQLLILSVYLGLLWEGSILINKFLKSVEICLRKRLSSYKAKFYQINIKKAKDNINKLTWIIPLSVTWISVIIQPTISVSSRDVLIFLITSIFSLVILFIIPFLEFYERLLQYIEYLLNEK